MTPLDLPRLSSAEARYLNILARRPGPIPVAVGGVSWELRFCPLGGRETASDDYRVTVDFGGARIDVLLDARIFAELLRGMDPGGDPSIIPGPLRQALVELALNDAAEALERACGHAIRVVDTGPVEKGDARKAEARIGFTMRRRDGNRMIAGELATDWRGLAMIADLVDRFPESEPEGADTAWDDLPIPLRLEVGWVDLPVSELRDLDIHDVILLDYVRLLDEDRLILRLSPRTALHARLHGSTIIIEGIARASMTDESDAPGADAADGASPGAAAGSGNVSAEQGEPLLDSLDDVQVRLTFDIGHQVLTLADLRRLSVGAVFDLARDPRSAVSIRAGGKLIGRGELVQIDDRVGVRVVSLAGNPK